VLAIGGLDPGGGAGVLADARAIHAAGAFACAAVAVLTVQSTSGLRAARALGAAEVLAQAREVLRAQRVRAIKTGALGSAANVRAVAALLAAHADVPAVVDTVMLPTRGRSRLLAERAANDVRASLIPRAWLVTANVAEAEALTGMRVASEVDAADAARALCAMGARAALVKGGHLRGRRAVDLLATPRGVYAIALPRVRAASLHGAGCTLASLIAGRVAARPVQGVVAAVRWAKSMHHAAIVRRCDVGGDLRVLVPD
jgi:hydroxymethylpyrimidine/phosphomethylpyrimidine kinase